MVGKAVHLRMASAARNAIGFAEALVVKEFSTQFKASLCGRVVRELVVWSRKVGRNHKPLERSLWCFRSCIILFFTSRDSNYPKAPEHEIQTGSFIQHGLIVNVLEFYTRKEVFRKAYSIGTRHGHGAGTCHRYHIATVVKELFHIDSHVYLR